MTDPISDMLTRIRNAQNVNRAEVLLPFSKVKHELGKILHKEGYIENVTVIDKEPRKKIKIGLKYYNDKPVIKSLKRISKPGKRIYKRKGNIPWVKQSKGIAVISTSHGLLTDREARIKGVGGEVVCEVW